MAASIPLAVLFRGVRIKRAVLGPDIGNSQMYRYKGPYDLWSPLDSLMVFGVS